jgi:hypothetical protein
MNIDNLIDGFTARLKEAGIPISNIDAAPWVDDLELKLAKRLPRSFSSLVRRYAFPPFEWQSLCFFGNSGSNQEEDLTVAIFRDRAISAATLKTGFMHFSQPAGGSYDPICFDARRPARNREFPIVRLDHEAILITNRTKVVETIAPSFAALAQSLVSSSSNPIRA